MGTWSNSNIKSILVLILLFPMYKRIIVIDVELVLWGDFNG